MTAKKSPNPINQGRTTDAPVKANVPPDPLVDDEPPGSSLEEALELGAAVVVVLEPVVEPVGAVVVVVDPGVVVVVVVVEVEADVKVTLGVSPARTTLSVVSVTV
jgi:hypothetical protein